MELSKITSIFSVDRRFNRDVGWNVGSLAILGVSGIVVNAVILRYQGTDALGVFNQVFAIYIILSQLGVGGVHLSALKHVSHNQQDLPKCAVICTAALLLAAGLSGVICTLAYLLRGAAGAVLESPGVSTGVALIVPGLLFFALNKVLLGVVNGVRHMRAYAIFNASRFVLIVSTIIAIVALHYPSDYLAASLSVAELCLCAALLVYVNVRVTPLRLVGGIWRWVREHLSFGFRGCLSGVLSEVNTRVDVLMLGLFCPDSVVGVYSFAAIIAEAISQIPLVVRRNVDPILGKHFAQGTIAELTVFARQVKRAVYAVMFIIALLAVAAFPVAVRLLVKDPAVMAGWSVFAILMTGNVLNSGYRAFWGILLQGGRPGMHTMLVFMVVVSNVILNAALIPLLAMHGAALATALVYVLEATLIFWFARRLFQVSL